MAEKENGEDPQVNLEMPSIGFGRKKKQKEPAPADQVPTEVTEPVPAQPSEETRPLYVDDVAPDVPATEAPSAPKPAKAPKPPKPPRETPLLPAMAAALLTGAVVGGLTVGLIYLGLLGCEELQNTSSCGGPGFFILVAIMVLMVVAGSWLLKFFDVVDPGSTSFLAVGLAVVIALLFFIEYLDEAWMAIVMPIICVATYALAHWVTVRYIEPADHG